ncbi:MAG: acetaldehyde dehydrogenase (acetylating) [Candidatus Altiarchaeia archaeon]
MSSKAIREEKLRVAILGSGLIGTDLLVKVKRSELLECTSFIGRNLQSPGMAKAVNMGVRISDQSIDEIQRDPASYDLVFDASSAQSHKYHALILERLGITAVDLTPSGVGEMCIPAVNLHYCVNYKNVNMVTCGGQSSIPLAHMIGLTHKNVEYIEVVSTIASRSAGPATRLNLDEYIETTERGIKKFSGCRKTKAILILNPAQPCINMQTTLSAKVTDPDIETLKIKVAEMAGKIHEYVPGYEVVVPPTLENDRIIMTVRVKGRGDYLPSYAGNLDIINCAAIAMAEEYARHKMKHQKK